MFDATFNYSSHLNNKDNMMLIKWEEFASLLRNIQWQNDQITRKIHNKLLSEADGKC
jgi:hypothetical protein